MERFLKRGDAIAERRLARAKTEIKSVLADELPGDVRIIETSAGILCEAPRLRERLTENSSLRDVAFLMRGVR